MDNKFKLYELLNKYNIKKLENFEDRILNKIEYSKIEAVLKYLIDELEIIPKNIEKCPSVINFDILEVKKNYEFLCLKGIERYNIHTCIHVLGCENQDLSKTYNFIRNQFGREAISTNTSSLAVPIDRIEKIINLGIFEENDKDNLTIAVGRNNIETIREMINSEEFKEHPELFTSQVLAHSNIEKIKEIIGSKEFKEHPELFTSTTLAHSNIEKIKEIIGSEEFKEHSELFTSTTLAHSNIDDIKKLLNMDIWKEERYTKFLSPYIVDKSKSMIIKIPILINIAKKYEIEDYINTSFLLKSPSQNYALINYMLDNKVKLINSNNKLNSCFGYQPGVLLKKYGINLNELKKVYKLEENSDFGNPGGSDVHGGR